MTAILKYHTNSFPFEERNLDLASEVKVGRAVAKCKPQSDNAIFDCKVLSRNHAVLWFSDGKFYIKDTCSSNGTFINNQRLGNANETSPNQEIHSNDIIQFGVEVVDGASKMTHGCIIIKAKLYYPNGSEASKSAEMYKDIPTPNLLPPYYSYSQMRERETIIFKKLNIINLILDKAHILADLYYETKEEEKKLLSQMNDLLEKCDEKDIYARSLESKLEFAMLELKSKAETIKRLESIVGREEKEEEEEEEEDRANQDNNKTSTTTTSPSNKLLVREKDDKDTRLIPISSSCSSSSSSPSSSLSLPLSFTQSVVTNNNKQQTIEATTATITTTLRKSINSIISNAAIRDYLQEFIITCFISLLLLLLFWKFFLNHYILNE